MRFRRVYAADIGEHYVISRLPELNPELFDFLVWSEVYVFVSGES